MTFDINAVFKNDFIIHPRKILGEYLFYLKDIPTKITIRISEELNPPHPDYPFLFETSHFIHTPLQASPYTTSHPWDNSAEGALHKALEGFMSYYRTALKQGNVPEKSWLVPNDYF